MLNLIDFILTVCIRVLFLMYNYSTYLLIFYLENAKFGPISDCRGCNCKSSYSNHYRFKHFHFFFIIIDHGDYEKIWNDHCKDKDLLTTYADCMHHLATDHWTKKSKTRIDWCRETALEFFHRGGLKQALEKDERKRRYQELRARQGHAAEDDSPPIESSTEESSGLLTSSQESNGNISSLSDSGGNATNECGSLHQQQQQTQEQRVQDVKCEEVYHTVPSVSDSTGVTSVTESGRKMASSQGSVGITSSTDGSNGVLPSPEEPNRTYAGSAAPDLVVSHADDPAGQGMMAACAPESRNLTCGSTM